MARVAGLLALTTVACAGPTREAPPAGRGAARPGSDDASTVVGTVAPDGTFRAETLPGARPDTGDVERSTVLTGVLTPPPEAETPSVEAGPSGVERSPGPPKAASGAVWRVQVFAARDRRAAEARVAELRQRLPDLPFVVDTGGGWSRVRAGSFASRDAAEPTRQRFVELGYADAYVVREVATP